MPAVSKAQLRFMAAVASGRIKRKGLSKEKAAEFVHKTKNAKELPERVGEKLREAVKRRRKKKKS